ncbi:ATP-dependent zinc metalloprotease FtsH [Clostridium estertheticum]|uniref:ATP-dependent zinc metalloprotease FtsH n=2 Tax=Clostridium estertheticum TaxID=238834 RepID=A0A1J0GCQ5_9CLOT|nr:ATP-dependent zinc metalloprotease FtsH [Clostridium estertheticum]APC39067.1 cell division protein FtsH [Clostridium estertheticum subsp. estertheticum]MBU3074964.1 ATP-dependent zinc metalloprotease FtsH [Clostridium estertheticum]MBU3165179.1 ATP-dependent zinc metalloprotease FtsH [Clostridium estertheticum]MBU3173796.1 ATP-dependent zinc metalloprotease FtsH [Clostridium estertheticum]MBU3183514.1 ATP-dependent zinc metalloprotease FtsH [Clostridium estertheticum]
MKKRSGIAVWTIVFVMVAVFMFSKTDQKSTIINFNQFQSNWTNNTIKSFVVETDQMSVSGTLKNGSTYKTIVPSARLFQFIKDHPKSASVEETYVKPPTIPMWLQYLPNVLLILMLVGFGFIFMKQSKGAGGSGGVMKFGKSKAKLADPNKKKVSFDDVAGADEEKAELAEIVDFLKQPKRYMEMGARIPKGVLLIGPPGTGKTLLARAISGEAGVPFFSISGSDFVEMFVGVGASRVRDLFEQAKKNSPCIIFIDEIDAVGRQRGAGVGGGNDEREQTLNQLLVEMDGFGENEGIIMIAATNRADVLDPALLRPGRFDRQILVGVPDRKGREAILAVHSKNKHLEAEVKLSVLAKRTPGFTGADIENLMNESALLTVRRDKKLIGMEELEEAATRIMAGPEKKSRVISEVDRKLTAYHEAGHAIVMNLLPNSDPVHQISIVPRGRAGGYTMRLPEEDRSYMSRSRLEEEIVGLLGGRVAEKLVIGDISTGASNDIERATGIARQMVMDYGMSDTLGTIAFGSGSDEVFLGRDMGKDRKYSEETAYKIDIEIKKLIDVAYTKALTLLTDNRSKLNAVAEELLIKEKLEGVEFQEIFARS